MSIKILYGSETGNSADLANQAEGILTSAGLDAQVFDMAGVSFDDLKGFEKVLIVTSTFGDGEPPFNATNLYNELQNNTGQDLTNLKYAVFALGQSIYPQFAKTGFDFHEFLAENGAKSVKEVQTSDDDFYTTFEPWLNEVKDLF